MIIYYLLIIEKLVCSQLACIVEIGWMAQQDLANYLLPLYLK